MKSVPVFVGGLVCCVVLCGCAERKSGAAPELTGILYSRNADLDDAMSFTGAPVERREQFKETVRGTLADEAHMTFARGLLRARDREDTEAFLALVHPESLGLLSKPDEKQMVHYVVEQINRGDFLYSKQSPEFFVTQQVPESHDVDRLFSGSRAKPSTAITFYHYHQPKNMLVGTRFFLVKEGDVLEVIFPARKKPAQQEESR